MIRNPAGERNKEPILNVLKKYIPAKISEKLSMLEVSSGPGLHSTFIASHFPNLIIHTTEYDAGLFKSIREYKSNFKVNNVLDPIFFDVSSEEINMWPPSSFDFILNINMIHITPWKCTEGLFKNSAKLLKSQGLLFTYGPYQQGGILEPESNVRFNQSLQSTNPLWGIRDIDDLIKIAGEVSIALIEKHDLPSNNKCLIWQKK